MVPGSASHPRQAQARKVMPGFSFAAPGPADGVGSLASRRRGLPRRQLLDRLCRTALDVHGFSCPFRHRYYDPLRLPNVHREILRYPARSLLPAASAFCCTRGIDPAEPRAFPAGSFGIAVDSHGYHPALIRALRTGNDEALPSSRAILVSAWPALRPRWSLPRLANDAMTDAAFRHVETVRVRTQRAGSSPVLLPHGTTSFKQLSGLNHTPYRLAPPGFRPSSLPADGLCYWAGG